MRDHHTSKIFVLLLVCTCSLFTSAHPVDLRTSRISFCDLLSNFENYDNQLVLTEAVIQASEHQVHLYDPKCKSTPTEDRSASVELPQGVDSTKLGKKLLKAFRRDHAARVAFQGVFHSRGSYGQEHTRFRLVIQRIITVEEVPIQQRA